jgi:NOL1/NOP2/fmu family ribosome biogenesis protein
LAEKDERHHIFSTLEKRFGIPETLFDEYLLLRRQKSWWLLKNSPLILSTCRLKISFAGLKAFQRVGQFLKPTTRMIQVFGYHASRALFEIDEDDLKRMLAGDFLPLETRLDNGYVILTVKGRVLGLGLLIDGRVRHQLPSRSFQA